MGESVILIVWVVVSIIVGIAAGSRGRNGVGWFFVSILLSPVLALLLLLVFPPLKAQESLKSNDAELRKNIKLGRRERRF
jgi:ABC-type transport system involved in cytochrome c biogenesis permease subunit